MSTVVRSTIVSFDVSEAKPDLIFEAPSESVVSISQFIPQLEMEPMLGLARFQQRMDWELRKNSRFPRYTHFRHRIKSSNTIPVAATDMPNVQKAAEYWVYYLHVAETFRALITRLPEEVSDATRECTRELFTEYLPPLSAFPVREEVPVIPPFNDPTLEATIIRHTHFINTQIGLCLTDGKNVRTENLKEELQKLSRWIYPYANIESLSKDAHTYIMPIVALAEKLDNEPQLFYYRDYLNDLMGKYNESDQQPITIIPRKT